MKTHTVLGTLALAAFATAASAEVTYTSTWSDQSGPAMLTSFDGSNDNLTFGYSNEGVSDATGFWMEEAPLSGTPNATAAWVTDLVEGDTVTVRMWFKGTESKTGATSKGRIWAHYTDNDDIDGYAGSAGGGPSGFAGADLVWEMQEFTWTIAAGQTALAVEARIYASPATDPEGLAYLMGDDMTIIVSNDSANVTLAGVVPAPGALALIGLGGLVARRRRA